jgi:SNF2 family DNA or RNA helicase
VNRNTAAAPAALSPPVTAMVGQAGGQKLKREQMHRYQNQACGFVEANPIAALFIDMGLGKTIITLTALCDLILDYAVVSKVLIIAPLRVARDTWPNELKKWEHLENLDMSVMVGSVQ